MTSQQQVNLVFTANTAQARQEIQSLQASLTNIANMPITIGSTQMTKQIKEASLAAMELKTHLANATNISTGTLDFSKLNTSLQASNVSLSQYAAKLLSIGPSGRQAFMQLANSVAQAEVPIRRSSTMLTNMMTTLKNTTKWQLASTAIHGVAGAISSAYNYSQRLDESLNNIRIVTGKSAEEMQKFAKSANEAAKALNASTTEYTNASLIYYQQGLSDQQVKERTDVTIKMANVARESSEVVSNQLTAIWNNFDDGSKALEYYADVITALGAATASSSSEISDGLEKFASVAKTVGLSYEYATAALATVTATTRQSADVVGTAFKTLLARLQDLKLGETLDDGTTLGTYTEHLAKVGVQIQDASGQLKDMDVILNEVAAKWDDLDRSQQVALAKGVAGIRQYNTFLSLMSNWDFMEDNLATVAKSGGTLEKQADIYGESWEAAQKRIKAAMESLYKSLIDPEFFKDLSEGIEKVVSVVDFLMNSLGGLSGVLSTVSVLLLKTFSNQVATSIRNVATNIYATSQYGREQIQREKSAQIGEMSRMMANTRTGTGDKSIANQAAASEYSTQLTMQQQLIDNQTNMDQSQIANCQQILDLRRQIGDKIMESAQQEENAVTNIKNLYSDMLTQKGAAMNANGESMTADDVRQLQQHKQALDDAITSQQRLENAVEEYKQALLANDAAAEDEQMSYEEKAQAAQRYRNALLELGKSLKEANPGMTSGQAHSIIADVREGARTNDAELEYQSLQQSRLNLTKQVATATNTLTQTDGVAQETVREMSNSIRSRNEAQREQNNLTNQGADLQDKYNKKMDEGKQNSGDWAKSIIAGAQGVMSLVSALQIASGLIDTLTNPDATGWEKFFAVLSSGSMIIMMVMSAMSSFAIMREQWTKGTMKNALATALDMAATKLNTAAQKKNMLAKQAKSKATDKDTGSNVKHAASEIADKTATDANGKSGGKNIKNLGTSFKNFGSSFKSFMGSYGAGIGFIAAGVAVAVGAIAWGINQFNKYENEAKEAAEQAQEAANGYKAVSEAYSAFTSNLDAYSNAQDGLKDLTKGTNEYREAVLKANEAALQLLNTYDNLEYTVDADGLINISEASLELAKEEQLNQLARAQRSNVLAQQHADSAELEKKKIDFQRDYLKSSQGNWTNAGNIGAATSAGAASGALIGLGIGSIVPVIGNAVGAAAGAIVGGVAGLITGIVGTNVAGSAANEEEEAINRLAEIYATAGNAQFATDAAFEKLLREDLKLDDEALIQSLVDNRESTLELVKEVSANTDAINAQNAAVVQDYFSDQLSKSGLNEEQQSAIASRSGALLDEKTEELYESTYKDKGFLGGGMSDEEVQKAYAEAMGWATNAIDNQTGNKAKYFNKDGTEVGVISDEVARRYLAEQEALKKLEGATTKLINKFKALESSSDKYDKALLSYLENKNFAGLSEDEYKDLYAFVSGQTGDSNELDKEDVKQYINEEFNNGKALTDTDAQNYGYETAEAFYNDFFDKLSLYEEHRASTNDNIANYAKNLVNNSSVTSTMSTEELSMMGEQVNKALIESGEEAARYVANVFYQKASGEAEKVAVALDGIDWSTIDADGLAMALTKAGVSTEYTTNELNTLIDHMTKDVSRAINVVASQMKILDKVTNLQQGDTISSEQFELLGAELQSYFTLMADGTYKLTQNALDFYQAVEQSKKSELVSELALREVEYNIATDIVKKGLNDYTKLATQGDTRNIYGTDSDYQTYLDKTIGAKGLVIYNPDGEYANTSTGLVLNEQVLVGSYQKKDYYAYASAGQVDKWSDTDKDGFAYVNVYRPLTSSDGSLKISGRGAHRRVSYNKPDGEWEEVAIRTKDSWEEYVEGIHEKNKEEVKTTEEQNKIIADQLLLLEQSTNPDTQTAVKDWKEALANNTLTMHDADEIYKKISNEAETIYANMEKQAQETQEAIQIYKNTLALQAENADERAALLKEGTINEEAYALAVSTAHEAEKMEGLDVEAVNDYAEHLQDAAFASEVLFDNMSQETLEDVAAYTMKMNRGVKTLASNFEEWGDILKKSDAGSQEFSDSLAGVKKAMSDVLGVQEEFISDNFILHNLEDIEKAANGDAEAIDRLAIAASRDILLNVNIQDESVLNKVLTLHDALAMQIPDIEVGATINSGEFLTKAAQIVEAANMTVEQANAYFRSLGFEPNFAVTETTIERVPQGTITTREVKKWADALDTQGNVIGSYPSEIVESTSSFDLEPVQEKVQIPALTTDGGKPNFTLTRTNAGSMNNTSSKNSGGKSGGSSSKPKKAEKVKKSDVVERYKEINDQLEKRADALNDANKAMDRMYGASRLQQMQKQNAVIKDEIDLLKQKKAEALKYLKEDRQAIADAAKEAGVTLTFDENGLISNYTEAMTEIYNELDKAINSANADGNASDSEQEKIDLIQKRADDLQSAIDQYDETWAEIDDLDNQLDDKFYEWQDNNAEMLSYKLELKLEVNDMELEEIEYELSKIEDDFYSMAEAAALMSSSNGKSQLGIYAQELADYTAQQKALEDAYKAGEISQAAYVEGMKEVRSGIYDNLSSLQELDKSMMEYYGNTLDMAAEEIAKYTDRMDHQTAVLDHYSSLLEIMGKSNDYKSMGKVLEGKAKTLEDQAAVAKETMEMYKDQAADRLAEYQDALARGDEAAAELYLGQYEAALSAANEAEEAYLSKAEEWAEALKAVLENKLADAGKDLEKALTGGASFDILTTQMERANSLQEEYLTTTNKIYETNKMINTAQQAIDKTTNTVAKQKLKSFQQETAQLQNKGKLSQYELEIQQAKYDLLLAEIALEEAQQAKSTVRLQRDSEGNFGYVYTADASQVSDAEQKLADAQNNLYNIGLEGANNYTQKYQETMREMYDTLTELQTQYLNGEFATEEEYHTAMEEAKAYYYQKLQDYSSLYQVALTTDSRVVADAWSTDFADMTYNTEGWMIAVDEYVDTVGVAFDEWSSQMDTIATDTGADLNSVEENIKDIITESTNLRDTLTGEDGVIAAIDAEATAVAKVTSNYALLRTSMQETIKKYEALGKAATESIKKQQKALAAANNNVTNYSGGSGSVGGSGNAGDGGTGSGNGSTDNSDDRPNVSSTAKVTLYASPGGGSMGKYTLQKGKFKISDHLGYSSSYYNYYVNQDSGLDGYVSNSDYKTLISLDTGGYTGSWGSEGKLAMLHQKELILNAQDTSNFLASLEVLREIMQTIDLHSSYAQISGMLSSPIYRDYNEPQTLEQQVHIEASFPGVQDRNEIEEAFNNLMNRATQFVNRK